MIAGTVTGAGAGGWYVMAPSVDPRVAVGPMESADLALAAGDRVLIAARADVPGTWVIVAKLAPA